MRKIKQFWYNLRGRLDPNETDVQKIFDRVIERGYYTERDSWMCISLYRAKLDRVVTDAQEEIAKNEIAQYLGHEYGDLISSLKMNNLDASFASRLAIYKDWANRPKLEVK